MPTELCLVVAGRIRPRALPDFGLREVFAEVLGRWVVVCENDL